MTIGENIRKLRMREGVTQEKLAEYLGITYQAISKWENNAGLPDISLIVPLSNFFGVSPDVLFGYTAQAEQDDVKQYMAQSAELMKNGRVREDLALWRCAAAKYPRSYECLSRLMCALFYTGNAVLLPEEGKDRDDLFEEALLLGQRILDDCTDGELMGIARQIMVYIYSIEGSRCYDCEKAAAMAESAQDIHTSRQFLLRCVYDRNSAEYRKINQELLTISIHTAADIIARDLAYDSVEEKIFAVKTALKLWDTLFYDGNYLFYSGTVRGLWITLAGCYTEAGEYDLAADALEKAYEILRYSENLEPTGQHYTSLFQNVLTHTPGDCAKTYTETERELFVSHLTQEAFEPLKGNAWYAELVRKCTIQNA
ncbi:MAG: helix-turn-helix transcriptional regulator [Clostridia bacterium]|nr:helix-turn-helix transcriptional regulator [Clostridia bacterium]